jgi:hypothetical protein
MSEEISEQMEKALEHLNAMVALGMEYKDAKRNAAIMFNVGAYGLGKAFESQGEGDYV